MDKNSQEIIVKFDEVTKQYGDLVVLDKLNLNNSFLISNIFGFSFKKADALLFLNIFGI